MPIKLELPAIPKKLKEEYELFVSKQIIDKNEKDFLKMIFKMPEFINLRDYVSYLDEMYLEYIQESLESLRTKNV